MNMGFFVWEFYPRLVGGLGSYAIEMTKKYVDYGNSVVVFTMNDGKLKTSDEWNGIQVHRPLTLDSSNIFPIFVTEDLKKWGTNINFFADVYNYNILAACKYVNLLIRREKQKFDITSVHDWLSSIAGLMIKNEMKDMPLVVHFHSIEEQRSLGKGSEVVKELERKIAERADKIITVSYSMKDFLASLGYPNEKIEVVYNGCDPEKYDPKKANKKLVEELRSRYGIKEEKVILFVGRLTWVKGIYNLIKAMPEVLKEFPNTKLIILGKGEDYNNLIALSQQLGLYESKVRIHSEWVSEEERIAHYALADLCVFPSISEPFGIVSLEAMAMEKPIVVGARGISGLREQVVPTGENKTGVHVNSEDPNDIAWGIKEILRNFEEAKEWGRNGRKRVESQFTVDIAARKTLEIYEKVVEQAKI
jgi:glycosyltransferase involved in cell wall biosynthesis